MLYATHQEEIKLLRKGRIMGEVNIKLTTEEILYLRERVTKDIKYLWEKKLEKTIIRKLDKAYKKPVISKIEYNKELAENKKRLKEFNENDAKKIMEEVETKLKFDFYIEE